MVFLLPVILTGQHVACDVSSKPALKLLQKAKASLSSSLSEAASLLEQAIEEEPNFAEAWFFLAKVRYQEKKYEKAKDSFTQLMELCPDYKDKVLFEFGKTCLALKDYAGCYSHFDNYLNLPTPNPRLAPEADSLMEVCRFYRDMYANPVPYEPKPLEGPSTQFGEYLPVISADNERLFFIRSEPSKRRSAISGETMDENFTMSMLVDGRFTIGEKLPSPFNLGSNEGGASLTIDNKEMFITICNRHDGKGSCDIYYTEFRDDEWSVPRNMSEFNPGINTEYWESQVSVSSDGKTLYFATYRPDGFGGNDIYRIMKDSAGNWSSPVNLGKTINTPGDEKSPFIHTDNRTLYFSSSGHQGLGKLDIFISRRDTAGEWSKPVNIGYPINSTDDDLGFFVSTDGRTGFFASNKLDGKGGWDIYGFNLYEGARPEKVLFIKGSVKDELGDPPALVSLELADMQTGEKTEIEVDDETGEYVYTEVWESDKMLAVQSAGYLFQTAYFKVNDTAAVKPRTVDFKMTMVEQGASVRIDHGGEIENLLFDSDSYELKAASIPVLANVIEFLHLNPSVRIEVRGHTDDIGSDGDNMVLSQNRAKAVYEYLIAKGVQSYRLSHRGFGESRPVSGNDTERGRSLNRRTEVVITSE